MHISMMCHPHLKTQLLPMVIHILCLGMSSLLNRFFRINWLFGCSKMWVLVDRGIRGSINIKDSMVIILDSYRFRLIRFLFMASRILWIILLCSIFKQS
jgi:hypothetical protein